MKTEPQTSGRAADLDLSLFWAKAGDAAEAHPVVCHLIDVGNVVLSFLRRPAARGLLKRLARALGASEEEAARIAAFLAAAHDIGKVSSGFARKREDLWLRILAAGFQLEVTPEGNHGRVTQIVLKRFLVKRGCNIDVAIPLAKAVAAHHGAFLVENGILARVVGVGIWGKAQEAHLRVLEEVFQPRLDLLANRGEKPLPAPWLMTLAGLTSFCDWIGSAEEYFRYEPGGARDITSYAELSRQRAQEALQRAGFTGWRPADAPLDFESAFGFPKNDMQRVVGEAATRLSEPGILVVEAPMGLGKTEAALAAADDLIRRHQYAGLYYALPTQATSNQMFGRLSDFLERRYEGISVDLHLLHGLSDLNEHYSELRLAAVSQDPDATVRASSWFGAAKRGLLAPFGVGTIDQALLAAMAVQHMFVRMAGLAGKVIILDEVHAYDTYMSELLDHLVSWLGALGSSVIVLSATLPAQRRRALIEAYGGRQPEGIAAHYPQVLSAQVDQAAQVTQVAPPPSTVVRLTRIMGGAGNEAKVARAIASRLQDGGCAAWICNTVEGAQRAYAAIRAELPDNCEHLLFHARFPTGQRLAIEKRALSLFGKTGNRPRRAVLVATQVVEQSLDLDFDVMITDLAPVDLVLQRAGRLHRHKRAWRPPGLETPELLWVEPAIEGGLPSFGVHEWVYERLILLRSWLALRDCQALDLPTDVPALVEFVYSRSLAVESPLRDALMEAEASFVKGRDEDQLKALAAAFARPSDWDAVSALHDTLEDDETAPVHSSLKAQTRLTRPSVTVICARMGAAGLELYDGSPLDLERPPGRDAVRHLRRASLTLLRWEWVHHLTAVPVPATWRRVAALRNCRLAVFEEGRLIAPGLKSSLELSEELGLVIHKLDAEGSA